MATIQITGSGGKRSRRREGAAAGQLAGSIYGPWGSAIGGFLGGAVGSLFGGSKPARAVTLDTDTNQVRLLTRDESGYATTTASGKKLRELEQIQRELAEVWTTGNLLGVPRKYLPAARLIAAERNAAHSSVKTTAPPPGEQPWRQYEMASSIIPPGGMAGFSQMTPASRLALLGRSGLRKSSRRRKSKSSRRSKKKAM